MELRELFGIIKKWLWLAAITTACSIIVAILISCFLIDTVYEATTNIMIRAADESDNAADVYVKADESLVKVYTTLAQSDLILQKTIRMLKIDTEIDKLRTLIHVDATPDTGFIKITVLDRSPRIAQDIANTLVKNLQLEASDIRLSGKVTVIDAARAPDSPKRPNIFLNMFIAAVAGLMAGVTLIIFLENMDDTVKSPNILIKDDSVPTIGAVPDFTTYKDSKPGAGTIGRQEDAYKIMRTKVNSLCSKKSYKDILITSPNSSEGKTFTAVNLAVSLGQMGKKVLLIDCNMRNSVLNTLFNLENDKGLTWQLTQKEEIPYEIRTAQEINLDVIVCGQRPDNPTELLESHELSNLINYGRSNYDMVIIDGSSSISFADTYIAAGVADAAILVVQHRKTILHFLKAAYESLVNSGLNILGVVVNKIRLIR